MLLPGYCVSLAGAHSARVSLQQEVDSNQEFNYQLLYVTSRMIAPELLHYTLTN